MSREDIVAVAVRLFAVYLVLLAVRFAAQALVSEGVEPLQRAVWLFAGAVAPLAAAALLWNFPLTVARKLLPVMRTPGTPLSSAGASIVEIGCTLLGLWLFAAVVPDAVHWAVYLFLMFRQDAIYELTAEHWGPIAAIVAEFAVAFWMMLGYAGIIGAIRRLRGQEPVA